MILNSEPQSHASQAAGRGLGRVAQCSCRQDHQPFRGALRAPGRAFAVPDRHAHLHNCVLADRPCRCRKANEFCRRPLGKGNESVSAVLHFGRTVCLQQCSTEPCHLTPNLTPPYTRNDCSGRGCGTAVRRGRHGGCCGLSLGKNSARVEQGQELGRLSRICHLWRDLQPYPDLGRGHPVGGGPARGAKRSHFPKRCAYG